MQFGCNSCKATLQIADEKVRGKRLVVRCKKCGAKITISDPGVAASAVQPAPRSQPVAQPAPQPAIRPAAESERDSDTESTRAMDSDLLEKALQASKRDDAASGAPGSPNGASLAPPAPRAGAEPPREAAPQRDPAIWFAMLGGKQTGPLSRAEVGIKTAQGAAGPRTYLWKEGMASWMRAKDVAEMAPLFAPAPEPKAPPPPRVAGAHPPLGPRDFSAQDFGAIDLSLQAGETPPTRERAQPHRALDLEPAPSAASPRTAPRRNPVPPVATLVPKSEEPLPLVANAGHDENPTNIEQLPLGERLHQEQVASELFNSGETPGPSALDLARWASSELDQQRPSSPELAQVARRANPLSQVPDSPVLEGKPKAHRTGEVLAFAGVQRSRTPLLIALIIGAILVAGALVWALSGEAPPVKGQRGAGGTGTERPADAPTPPAPLGGTGAPAVTALAAKGPATPAPDERSGDRPAKKKADVLTPDQQADLKRPDLKRLENERGVGTHGPSAAQAGETPDVEKAEAGLTAADVRKKLGQSKGVLQGCIDEALRREPNLRVGKIHIATTIAPSGSVTAARIDKQTVDKSLLGSCLKRATRRIVFPSFQGEAFEVDIPIVVTAGE